MLNSELTIIFMPSLLELFTQMERDKKESLTESEVLNIRDNAVCMTISIVRLKKIEEDRGYKDINPENCWEDWCLYKSGKINNN